MKMQPIVSLKRICLVLLSLMAIHTGIRAQKPGTNTPVTAAPATIPGAYTGTTVNYVRTWIPSMGITDPDVVSSASRKTKEVKQTTQYLDGLGRPLQVVTKGISGMPDPAAESGYDLVAPVAYDQYGREVFKYIPYAAETQDGKFRANPFVEQNNMLQNQYAGEKIFYTRTDYEASPLNRVQNVYNPGNSWAKNDPATTERGGNKPLQQQYLFNILADAVRIWKIEALAGSVPTSPAAYTAGELLKASTKDASGNEIIEYKNKEGQLILKKVQIADIPAADHGGWLCTYYVYDEFANLRYVLPPKAVERLVNNDWSLTDTSFRKELCFRYEYDSRRRMILKQVPGAQPEELVYDQRDRMVFMQNGNMRPTPGLPGKWHAVLYDELNRPVMTALFTTSLLRSQLESALSVATPTKTITHIIPATDNLVVGNHDGRLIYKARTFIEFREGFDTGGSEMVAELDPNGTRSTETIYATNTLPDMNASNLEPLTYTYYENYNYADKKAPFTDDLDKPKEGLNPYKETPVISQLTKGMVTGSKIRILGTDEWLTTSTYYDNKGRVQQILSDNAAGGVDITTSLYNFNGKVLSVYKRHRNPQSGQTPETRVLTMIRYDHAGREIAITKQLNDEAATLHPNVSTSEYDLLNQLRKKTFRKQNEDVMESMRYDYNVHGWIGAINKEYIDGTANHYFAQEISYDQGFINQEFNGNVAGTKWKGYNDPVTRAYSYKYDGASRLLRADFTQAAGGDWNQSANINYDVKMGDGITPTSAYDANGNIKHMRQWGLRLNGDPLIDDLTYTLEKPGVLYTNKLFKVNDANNDATSTLGDFKDLHPDYAIDYTYDLNGNMTIDHNKNIAAIRYNHLNLPIWIDIAGKGQIEYVYDAAGKKLKKIVTDNTTASATITTTDYIDGYVYENTQMKFLDFEEGRIRPVYKTGQPVTYVFDYFLKDHLGNIRTVLTEETTVHQYAATMETSRSTVENALFNNIENTRTAKPAGYPNDPDANPNDHVARLNADANGQKTGPSLVLRVMAGDKIQIGAKAFYKSTGTSTSGTTVNNILNSLIAAFTGEALPGDSKGAAIDATTPLSSNFTPADYQRLREQDPSQNLTNKPKAYLNFVLFDDQFKIVDENSGAKQVQGNPDELQVLATGQRTMKKSGYLYVYTNNESLENVYFDNLVVIHEPSPMLEETHYYPFGLTMAGISSKAAGKTENKNTKFQGQPLDDELDLNLYGFKWRSQDPQIGRFIQIDPLAADYAHNSTYAFSENKVTGHVELEGLESVVITLGGRATGYGGSVSGGYNLIIDRNADIMLAANTQAGFSYGVSISMGISGTLYPKAKSYNDMLGWGGTLGALLPSGKEVGVALSFTDDNYSDFRLGLSGAWNSWGKAYGVSSYVEFGRTWPLWDEPKNFLRMGDKEKESLAGEMGIDVRTLNSAVAILESMKPQPLKPVAPLTKEDFIKMDQQVPVGQDNLRPRPQNNSRLPPVIFNNQRGQQAQMGAPIDYIGRKYGEERSGRDREYDKWLDRDRFNGAH